MGGGGSRPLLDNVQKKDAFFLMSSLRLSCYSRFCLFSVSNLYKPKILLSAFCVYILVILCVLIYMGFNTSILWISLCCVFNNNPTPILPSTSTPTSILPPTFAAVSFGVTSSRKVSWGQRTGKTDNQ